MRRVVCLARWQDCCFSRTLHTYLCACSLADVHSDQLHHQPAIPHKMGSHHSSPRGPSLHNDRSFQSSSVHLALPVTQLPEFGSTDNILKALFSIGKKKGGDDMLSPRHLDQLHRLVVSLHRNPSLSKDVWRVGLVPKLIEFSRCGEKEFERQARMALSLVGHAPFYSGRGLRILSVDGGGTR